MAKSVYERFGQSAVTGTAQAARRYTVVGGDTITSIAATVYPDNGYDSEAWRQLAEYNNIDDLDTLAYGQVLTIPKLKPSDT